MNNKKTLALCSVVFMVAAIIASLYSIYTCIDVATTKHQLSLSFGDKITVLANMAVIVITSNITLIFIIIALTISLVYFILINKTKIEYKKHIPIVMFFKVYVGLMYLIVIVMGSIGAIQIWGSDILLIILVIIGTMGAIPFYGYWCKEDLELMEKIKDKMQIKVNTIE